MAYADGSRINNFGEYQGLDAAERYCWSPLSNVGDSMMIIRLMTHRSRPKAKNLRSLFDRAITTADALGVRSWTHQYRTHNKMADNAANQAMYARASYQAHASDARQELHSIREWLPNDTHRNDAAVALETPGSK